MAIEPNSDDWELLSRAYSGVDWAVDQLVKKYRERLFRYAMGFLNNQESAEDVVQETMMELFKTRRAPKTSQSTVSAWLFKVCGNKCKDLLRKIKSRPELPLDSSVSESEPRSTQTTDIENIENIKAALNRLDPRERLVIELRYLAAEAPMGNRAIAQALSISESAATKLHNRAIRELRRCLGLPPDDTRSG